MKYSTNVWSAQAYHTHVFALYVFSCITQKICTQRTPKKAAYPNMQSLASLSMAASDIIRIRKCHTTVHLDPEAWCRRQKQNVKPCYQSWAIACCDYLHFAFACIQNLALFATSQACTLTVSAQTTKSSAWWNLAASTHSQNRLHPKSGCGRSVENELSRENDTILPHVLL